MKIGVGYRNGIGNFCILTSILRCLEYHSGNPVDLLVDDEWAGETRDAVVLLASKLPFIEKVVHFPSEFDPNRYDALYMSTHSGFGPLLHHVLGDEALNPERVVAWGEDFYHERDHYLMEIMNQFKYKGPVFSQQVAMDKEFMAADIGDLCICISNGYLRSASGIWEKKTYGRWNELLELISSFYSNVVFLVLGGLEDKRWAKELSVRSDIKIENFAGQTDILQTAALIERSGFIISTDTGVFHIADALGKPGIVLFGPTLVSKNGPLNGTIIPLQTRMECGGCQSTVYLKTCNHPRCMDMLEPRLILATMRMKLRGKTERLKQRNIPQ